MDALNIRPAVGPKPFSDAFSLLAGRRALFLDLVMVGTLVAVAAVLRFWDLGDIPHGLHGDEASTGLEARRILEEGSIGPYSPAALGQPAGPMYVAAAFEKVFGSGVATPRMPMALFGAATVILAFFALRSMFGRPAAYLGAFLLTFSAWLIFYNRTGYTVSVFPLTEAAALLAVWTATRRESWVYSVIAGAVVGIGIYGYFAYPLFAFGLGLWVLIDIAMRRREHLGMAARNTALMAVVTMLVAWPMRPYITGDTHGYLHDRTAFSIFNTKKYKEAQGFEARFNVVKDNAVVTFERVFFKKRPDASDGSGEWPDIDPILLALAAIGLAVSGYRLLKERDPRYLLAPILFVFVSVGPVASLDGTNRRSLGMLVPIVMLASIAGAVFWSYVTRVRSRDAVYGGLAITVVVLGAYGWLNAKRYFEDGQGTSNAIYSFGPELTEAAKTIASQQPGTVVYFASERWSVRYETFRYLCANVSAQDRSKEFGSRQDWDVDRRQPALILVLGRYREQAEAIAKLYPDGTRLDGPIIAGSPSYVAFHIPAATAGR